MKFLKFLETEQVKKNLQFFSFWLIFFFQQHYSLDKFPNSFLLMKWEAFPVTKIKIKCDHFNLNVSIYDKLI